MDKINKIDYSTIIDQLDAGDKLAVNKFEAANILLDQVFDLLKNTIYLSNIKDTDNELVLLKEKIGKYFGHSPYTDPTFIVKGNKLDINN